MNNWSITNRLTQELQNQGYQVGNQDQPKPTGPVAQIGQAGQSNTDWSAIRTFVAKNPDMHEPLQKLIIACHDNPSIDFKTHLNSVVDDEQLDDLKKIEMLETVASVVVAPWRDFVTQNAAQSVTVRDKHGNDTGLKVELRYGHAYLTSQYNEKQPTLFTIVKFFHDTRYSQTPPTRQQPTYQPQGNQFPQQPLQPMAHLQLNYLPPQQQYQQPPAFNPAQYGQNQPPFNPNYATQQNKPQQRSAVSPFGNQPSPGHQPRFPGYQPPPAQ